MRHLSRGVVLAALALGVLGTPLAGVRAQESPSKATEAARQAFEQMKQGKLDEFAASLHPEDVQGFSQLIIDLLKSAEKSENPSARGLLQALGQPADLEQKTPSEVTTTFLQVITQQVPGYEQMMKEAEFKILGEVPAGDDTYAVVYQFVQPTPQVVEVSRKDDAWYLRLDSSYKQMASMMKNVLAGEAPPNPSSVKLNEVEILGTLPQGDDQTLVIVRTTAAIGDLEVEKSGVVPVTSQDPEWALLAPEKKDELAKALKQKLSPGSGQ